MRIIERHRIGWLMLAALPACGGGGDGGGTGPVTAAAVVITAPAAPPTFGALGRTVQFSAEARDAGGAAIAGKAVSWSSSSAGVASVSSGGLVTALSNGTTQIRATADGVQSAAITVTVTQVTVTVAPNPAAVAFGAKGSTRQLAAEARDSTGNPIAGKVAAWTGGAAGIATVSASGLLTSVDNGATSVTATIDGVSAQVNVTVAVVVAAVVVTPANASFGTIGRTQQFAAEARDSNTNALAGKVFVWSSTNNAAMTVDPVTGLGTVQGTGAAQVRATTDNITGSAAVTANIVVVTVTVAAIPAFTRINQQKTAAATALDSLANVIPNAAFSWNSGTPGVAQVDAAGVVTSQSDGNSLITAMSAGVGGSATATVSAVANGVNVTPAAVTFGAIGSSRQLAAAVVDSGNTGIPGRNVVWTPAGPGTTATVSGGGLVTATATGTGDSAVATYTGFDGTFAGKAPITVTQVAHSITVTPVSAGPDTLATTGRTRQFQAAAADSNGNAIPGAVFTWGTSAPAVAQVDNTGLATAGALDGTANITASNAGRQGSRALVVRRFAETFSINPSAASIVADNGTQVFTGNAQDSVGTNLPITWTSRNTTVVTVSPANGSGGSQTTATAVNNGATYVVLAGGTRTDSAQVTTSNQLSVSFAAQVQPIFTANCAVAGCHTPPSLAAGQNLSAGQAYANIVNVPSSQLQGWVRVAPGDTTNSLLYRKIRDVTPPVGDRMPAGRPPLSAGDIATIRDWILSGAPDNAPPAPAPRR